LQARGNSKHGPPSPHALPFNLNFADGRFTVKRKSSQVLKFFGQFVELTTFPLRRSQKLIEISHFSARYAKNHRFLALTES
jgi:hypothetical protein